MNFLNRAVRYSRWFFRLTKHYWMSTRSIDMMWRFFLTEAITILNALLGGMMVSVSHWVYKFCNKAILFTTPWGTYLAHTRNAWMITQPGYEEEI